ncbi:Ser/Thr protein phosphatase family protein [Dacryopinax primogenitus]|uniref:Ser/Thr protein phosphatase family protein n=1 Tax=Dacryopinax primogenitus (strain DJM 731) TaxID=1858805 RepID=M5G0Z6_DACPD|nr:Ser/Thr protein phosphatase family protein [Dacryopinax primogenitus]EJU01820.1 Ser/Thr protein phosphatase family protein [Dacryopinax primogenitus]
MLALLLLPTLGTYAQLPPHLATASSAFTGKPNFPANLFAEYWPGYEPTQTKSQVQPKVTDPVSGVVYPLELTDANTIPDNDLTDPYVLPPSLLQAVITGPLPANASLSTPGSSQLASQAVQSIMDIINGTTGALINNTCGQCLAALGVGKVLANTAPWEIPGVLIELCNLYGYDSYGTCAENFGITSDGDVAAQILALADVTGQDGEYICAMSFNSACDLPAVNTLDMDGYFSKPKPANAVAPPPSGERIRVLHLSDFHLDPRYATHAEASCSQYLCCRSYSDANSSPNKTVLPAPRYGAYSCDTPYDLAGVAVEAIPELAGAGKTGREFDFAIFTGDLVSHDNDNQLGRAYVEYEETSIFSMIKHAIGGSPLFAALGNHDSWPQALNSPVTLTPSYLADQYSWNYEHISSLWAMNGWIDDTAKAYASVHYGGYAYTTWRGLKVISFNTDFWYTANWYNYINTSNPDISGQFRWMTDELQKSEDAGERVWIIGHVPPGWDAYSAIPNPTNLFYQIVARYSPHVIAEIFFGHNHEDEFAVYYDNNATNPSAATALATSWIVPSLTPLTNLNSGFRAYDVDPVTFNVLDSYTWISNISAAAAVDNQTSHGAVYSFEYSAREAYGANIPWPATAPLNATWWHLVTEQWESNPSLVEKFTTYQGKNSVKTGNCTSQACVESKICYARSGSFPISGACPYGSKYGSVQ